MEAVRPMWCLGTFHRRLVWTTKKGRPLTYRSRLHRDGYGYCPMSNSSFRVIRFLNTMCSCVKSNLSLSFYSTLRLQPSINLVLTCACDGLVACENSTALCSSSKFGNSVRKKYQATRRISQCQPCANASVSELRTKQRARSSGDGKRAIWQYAHDVPLA